MTRRKLPSLETILALVLFVALGITVTLQIASASKETTKLETALFSTLQFLFSLAFAWLISRSTLRNEFQASQKRFALSAYRRITEISLATDRLLDRVAFRLRTASQELHGDLEIVTEIALGIRESISSSLADWADIIGEEIEAVQRIQRIRQAAEAVSGSPATEQSPIQASETASQQESDIERIVSTLPQSLKVAIRDRPRGLQARLAAIEALRGEQKRKGFLELDGFYDNTFDLDPVKCKPGDILHVRIDDVSGRIAALIAFDDKDRSLGVIVNTLSLRYDEFVHVMASFMGSSRFDVRIVTIAPTKERGRRAFTVRTIAGSKRPRRPATGRSLTTR